MHHYSRSRFPRLQGWLSGCWEEFANLNIPYYCIKLSARLSEQRDLVFSGKNKPALRYDVLRPEKVEPVDNPPSEDAGENCERDSLIDETSQKLEVTVEQPGSYSVPAVKIAVEFLLTFWGVPQATDKVNTMIDETLDKRAHILRPPHLEPVSEIVCVEGGS